MFRPLLSNPRRRPNKISWAVVLAVVICFPAESRGQDIPPEATKSLQLGRDYSDNYIARLPDFLCVQTTRQFEADAKGRHWKQGDRYTSKLVFTNGKEKRTLLNVNGRPPSEVVEHRGLMRPIRRPLTSEGEFGILLANVLGSGTPAHFTWRGWADENGHQTAIFDYAIDKENSTVRLSLSDLAEAVLPYHGTVKIDGESGEVRSITSQADQIPDSLQTRTLGTLVEYGPVRIGEQTYQLPQHATVLVTTRSSQIRNDLEFAQYQKFETKSTIDFGAPVVEPPQQ